MKTVPSGIKKDVIIANKNIINSKSRLCFIAVKFYFNAKILLLLFQCKNIIVFVKNISNQQFILLNCVILRCQIQKLFF